MATTVHHGDCLEVLRGLPSDSLDACVTDPPYGLSFMGKGWDYDVPSVDIWREVFRVLKPGAHLLAFAGTRTQHRMAVNIEDAGFEIRDMIAWVYGSGFPKSLDVSKAIDKRKDWNALHKLQAKVKAAREAMCISQSEAARRMGLIGPDESLGGGGFMWFETGMRVPSRAEYPALKAALGLDDECDMAFEEAEREITGHHENSAAHQVWMQNYSDHVALPPKERRDNPATDAARKWQGWGTALKPALEPVTVARKPLIGTVAANVQTHGTGALNIDGCRVGTTVETWPKSRSYAPGQMQPGHNGATQSTGAVPSGRWPANLIHDGSEEVLAGFPETKSGSRKAGEYTVAAGKGRYGDFGQGLMPAIDGDFGSAARFFYCPKASKADRDEGNGHPTVKPTDLMRYLCRLVTPPGGTVLDPFMGSGSTGKAATLEGFSFVGVEREAEYIEIARARIEHVKAPDRSGEKQAGGGLAKQNQEQPDAY